MTVDRIYYFLDRLNSRYKEQVEEISFNYTRHILKGKIGVVFYDMTTIYFESSQPDDFRETGYSKDGKHHLPQIYLGLLVGKNGYPIGYDIFEGNIYEGHTLIPMIERFEKRFNLDKPIVVADAGLLSSKNIQALEEKGYTYIIGARIKNEKDQIKDRILQLSLKDGQIHKIKKPDNTTLFISYSARRAKKDLSNRERGLKRLEKNLKAGKLTKSNINNRGYNKYLLLKGELKIEIDYQKFKTDTKWDGLKGYITNTKLSGEEVIENYNNLWKIEKAFRISKTDLKIRPVYHRLRERIEAHICISFVSYLLYKELERILPKETSINKAIKSINKMYEIVLTDRKIRLKNNEIQNKIIEVINANF
jgi:transposase